MREPVTAVLRDGDDGMTGPEPGTWCGTLHFRPQRGDTIYVGDEIVPYTVVGVLWVIEERRKWLFRTYLDERVEITLQRNGVMR